MTVATDLLQRHFQTLVDDNAQWQTLITDDVPWELVYAPSLDHPARLSGREEVERHVAWFVGAVETLRFFDLRIYPFADPEGAVAEVKAEGRIKSTGRTYRQEYVLFLRAKDGKIAYLREYFDPVLVEPFGDVAGDEGAEFVLRHGMPQEVEPEKQCSPSTGPGRLPQECHGPVLSAQ